MLVLSGALLVACSPEFDEETELEPSSEPESAEANESDARSRALPPALAVDPALRALSLGELQARAERVRGDRAWGDLSLQEQAEFDRLARAIEYRLGIHAVDHPDAAASFDPFSLDEIDPDPTNHYALGDVPAHAIYRGSFSLPWTPVAKQFTTSDLKQLTGIGFFAAGGVPGMFPVPDTTIIVRRGTTTWRNDDCNANTKSSCVTTSTASGTYVVTVYSTTPDAWGTMDLRRDGSLLVNDAAFGGTVLDVTVPGDGSYLFETVHLPAGATDTQMVLFDSAWNERAYDNDSGIGTAARINFPVTGSGMKLLVGAYSGATVGATRTTRVLVNTCTSQEHQCHLANGDYGARGDFDRDSLSNGLEEELGTDPTDFDTDDDGLFDYVEVFGHREGTAELSLVQIGASPRRRDLFVEVDYASNVPAFTEIELTRAQEMFGDMPTLVNPDGSTGIEFHADIDRPCMDFTLCGDWGGSTPLANIDAVGYHGNPEAMKQNFAPVRWGSFKYAFLQWQYTGQYSSVPWAVRTTDWGTVLAHELGHTYGLHHGGETQEDRNYKLNYLSTMNYSFQSSIPTINSVRSRFSSGEYDTIDHRALNEVAYSPGLPKTWFDLAENQGTRYGLTVDGDSVDWNRDGRISPTLVMADDGPIDQHRTGQWPELANARVLDDRIPTGGLAMAVVEHDSRGIAATTYAFAPYEHADGVYPEVAILSDTVTQALPWPGFSGGIPLPGDGLLIGEVGAAKFDLDIGTRIVLTFPDSSGRLMFNLFDPNAGFTGPWTVIPSFPEGRVARNATMAVIGGQLVVLFREVWTTSEDEPNVWLVRMDSAGQWGAWERLAQPSWATPGIAEGPDGNEYLAWVDSSLDHKMYFSSRPIGSTDPFVVIPGPRQEFTNFDELPASLRSRVTLLFRPFRYVFGDVFEDGSGYLSVFWNGGKMNDRNSWHQYRANLPGYIGPDGPALMDEIAGWRGHGMLERARPDKSPAIVARHTDVQVAYDAEIWNTAASVGVYYQPFGGGTGAVNPYPHDDRDDVSEIAAELCSTLRSSTTTACRCTLGPKATCQ